jgi:hypothetical protein
MLSRDMFSRSAISAVLTSLILLGSANAATAGPLGLEQRYPDISTSKITVTYDAATHDFRALGDANSVFKMTADGVTATTIGSGSFHLTAKVDNSGRLTPNTGVFELRGDAGAGLQTLLYGNLAQFAWAQPAGWPMFDFLVTTSAIGAVDFGRFAGVSLVRNRSLLPISWGSSFTITGATANSFATVPEPGVAALLAAALFSIRRGRRSSRLAG